MWGTKGENWRNAWDYEFEWTPDHFTKEELEPLAYTYDELAAECLDILDQIVQSQQPSETSGPSSPSSPAADSQASAESTPTGANTPSSSSASSPSSNTPISASSSSTSIPDSEPKPTSAPHTRDYYTLLQENHHLDPTLTRLWTELTTLPPWASYEQLARGQDVFYRYAGPAVAGLTFQSLLGGMGGYRVVETLSRTGGFSLRVARRRLLETFQHVLSVTRGIDSLRPGGEGFVSSVRVRFLHASVRRKILALARRDPAYYDVGRHGVPVNDLDSLGTVAAFSSTLLWVSFPRQGIRPSPREAADYVALWRYLAHLLGAPHDPYFATAARARALAESLMLTEIAPTPTSRVLANNIVAALADQPPTFASRDFLRAECWWLNGPALSAALAVPKPGLWYRALVAAQCLGFMAIIYVTRAVPAWDRWRIARLRANLGRITVALSEGKAEHGFKYVPAAGRMTKGEEARDDGEVVRGGGRSEAPYSKALVVGGAIVAAVAWLGLRYASGVFR